jgi:hypothetical protein
MIFQIADEGTFLEETEIMCCKCCFQGRAQKAFHATLLEGWALAICQTNAKKRSPCNIAAVSCSWRRDAAAISARQATFLLWYTSEFSGRKLNFETVSLLFSSTIDALILLLLT